MRKVTLYGICHETARAGLGGLLPMLFHTTDDRAALASGAVALIIGAG
jgi:hypothetical protein